MSTTVTYKGQTLGTVNNETRTLDVKGFYCEDDITLTDVTQGGGGQTLLHYVSLVPETTLTNNNKASVQLDPGYCVILVICVDDLTPPASGYIAITWYSVIYADQRHSTILRANGTVGSDNNQCSFNRTTGILQLGGQYGYFPAGTHYDIYQFSWPELS